MDILFWKIYEKKKKKKRKEKKNLGTYTRELY